MARQIILDTETTGLSPEKGHRMIEIGCMEMINRRLTRNNFHAYINPERAIDAEAIKVHGITSDFLKDKSTFSQIADALFAYLRGAELIIHNAPFDIGFLNAEFARVNKTYVPITHSCSVIDTLTMARSEHPGQQNTLDALCRRYGVNNKHRDLHGALIDAALLAEVYLMMTGGQEQLFATDTQLTSENKTTRLKKTSRPADALPVIIATSEEINAHEKFLDLLATKGKCVWRASNADAIKGETDDSF